MILKFKDDVELTVVTNLDEETDSIEEELEIFLIGDEVEVDILEEKEDSIDVQFGNGSCAYNVLKEWVKYEHISHK